MYCRHDRALRAQSVMLCALCGSCLLDCIYLILSICQPTRTTIERVSSRWPRFSFDVSMIHPPSSHACALFRFHSPRSAALGCIGLSGHRTGVGGVPLFDGFKFVVDRERGDRRGRTLSSEPYVITIISDARRPGARPAGAGSPGRPRTPGPRRLQG